MDTGKFTPAMILTEKIEYFPGMATYKIAARFVKILGRPDQIPTGLDGGQSLRNFSSYHMGEYKHHLADLVIEAQGDPNDREQGVYAFRIGYEKPYVNLEDVEAMRKTLRYVHRRLEKIIETEGPPLSFGQYIGRCAKIFGARRILFQTEGRSSSYAECEYRFSELGPGVETVDYRIRRWQETGEVVDARFVA